MGRDVKNWFILLTSIPKWRSPTKPRRRRGRDVKNWFILLKMAKPDEAKSEDGFVFLTSIPKPGCPDPELIEGEGTGLRTDQIKSKKISSRNVLYK